jgi:hypothetical protein
MKSLIFPAQKSVAMSEDLKTIVRERLVKSTCLGQLATKSIDVS